MGIHPRHHTDYRLRCVTCGREYPPEPYLFLCRSCSAEPRPGRALRGVLEVIYTFAHVNRFAIAEGLQASSERGMRRYLGLLPIENATSLPPLLVGDTPLNPGGRLSDTLGLDNLYLKDDTRNPTGSLKDRASALVVAKAIEAGARTVCTASTGNAATALAGLAASVGLECVVIVPATAPPAKLAQMLVYGARIVPVRGTYDQAFDLSSEACAHFGWYNRNTAYNPYTIDGKRTAAFEIWEQLGYEAPDSVWIPVGDGVILSGVAKGFRDLKTLGLIERAPRLIACQAEGSPAIVRALERGFDDPEPVAGAASIADSIVVEAPRNGILALRDIRESGGRGVTVSDAEILSAMAELGRLTGIFVEPSCAAAVAVLRKECKAGRVNRSERAVVLLTGTGLKDPASARKAVALPPPIEPTLENLKSSLAG